jgi:PAS domain S-box-containing protein
MYRDRDISNVLFVLSIFSFSVGGLTLEEFEVNSSISTLFIPLFCYFTGYTLLFLIFIWSIQQEKPEGIGSFFIIKNELKHIETLLHETQKRYELIVENTRDVIILQDLEGTITYLSPSSKTVLGFESQDLLGKKLWDVSTDDSEGMKKKFYDIQHSDSSVNYALCIQTKGEGSKWFSLQSTPIINNNIVETIITSLRDINDLKSLELEMIKKVEMLEKTETAALNIMDDLQETINHLEQARTEINKKNQELQTQTENLLKVNTELVHAREDLSDLNKNLERKVVERTGEVNKLLQQKDEFINQLGHDLKTPLTPLVILLPILQKKVDDAKLQEMLAVTIQNVDYMKNLVVKTLQLASLNSLSISPDITNINLFEIVNKIAEKNSYLLDSLQITITNKIDEKLQVQADNLLLSELLDNLFSNAIKYSLSRDGNVSIDAKNEGDMVTVSIQDSGIGLTSEQLNHIFDEFYKADPSRHDLGSTGLGLSICKRIVEKHGGKIWAESAGKGKGSTFYFTLSLGKKVITNLMIS